MQLRMTAKKTTITEGMKGSVESKLAFLKKFLKEDTEVFVTVELVSSTELKIEALFVSNGHTFKAEEVDTDFYFGMDTIADKLKRQISRHHSLEKSMRTVRPGYDEFEGYKDREPVKEKLIYRRKKFNMKPMHEEEAVLQMEMLGHTSFMFYHANLEVMCLLYKRNDGKYGLIEGTLGEDEE